MTRPDSPQVLMSENVSAVLRRHARKAEPDETGGILLGVRTNGRPWITVAVEIASPDRGHSHYRLPAGATSPAVARARQQDPRLGYLGEWHSHPADVGPSPTDRATMRRLALRCLGTGLILIVVRRGHQGHWLDIRETAFPFLRRHDAVLTGDLPSKETPTA